MKVPASANAAYIRAFTNAIGTVFEVAAAVVAVAFLLSWLLEERPLRETIAAGSGVGESFAVPRDTSSLSEAARGLTRLIGRKQRRLLVERLAERAAVNLSAAGCWLLVRLHEDPSSDIALLCDAFDVPMEVALAALGELEERALLERSSLNDVGAVVRRPTPTAEEIADRLMAERQAAQARLCEEWAPEEHDELSGLLRRLVQDLPGDPALKVEANV